MQQGTAYWWRGPSPRICGGKDAPELERRGERGRNRPDCQPHVGPRSPPARWGSHPTLAGINGPRPRTPPIDLCNSGTKHDSARGLRALFTGVKPVVRVLERDTRKSLQGQSIYLIECGAGQYAWHGHVASAPRRIAHVRGRGSLLSLWPARRTSMAVLVGGQERQFMSPCLRRTPAPPLHLLPSALGTALLDLLP